MDRLPIERDGRRVSHLSVRLDRPADRGASDLCFLYLHGFGSSQSGEKADFFRRRLVERGHAFCSFDFQGHGESGGRLFDLTLTRNLADVGRVHGYLRARGFERLVLVGSSMGGGTALWYAAHRPSDVVAGLHVAPALDFAAALLRDVGPEGERHWRETGSRRVEGEMGSCDLSWGLIDDLRSYDLARLQRVYATPTLLVQGQRDASLPWRTAVDFAAGCTAAPVDLHLIADGDHRLLAHKERVWRLMESFLGERGVVAGGG